MLIGALFGLMRAGGGNPVLGLGTGGCGWFIAAAVVERTSGKDK